LRVSVYGDPARRDTIWTRFLSAFVGKFPQRFRPLLPGLDALLPTIADNQAGNSVRPVAALPGRVNDSIRIRVQLRYSIKGALNRILARSG